MKQLRKKAKEVVGMDTPPQKGKVKVTPVLYLNGALATHVDHDGDNGQLPGAFFVKDKGGLERIEMNDILFLKADLNYVELVMEGNRYVLRNSLSELLERLPGDRFHRVNRSTAINLAHLDLIDGNIIHVGPHRIPLSRSLRNALLECLRIISGR